MLNKGEIVESGSMVDLRKKYQAEKIELEFQNESVAYQSKVDELPSIVNSYVERNLLHVTATDIEKARQEILTAASAGNWPLTSFTLNRASLEDMFMKVVNQ